MLHSFKPEGGTLWLLIIVLLESIDTAINYGNFIFLLVVHLNENELPCIHLFLSGVLQIFNVIFHVLCLLFPKFFKRW